MDFSLSDEQQAIVELARRILTDRCTPTRLKEIESTIDWFDRETWMELANADLLGLTLAEDIGGGGFGFLEACLLLNEVGRVVAPLPLLPTIVAAMTIDRFGTAAQREQWLPGTIAGTTLLTVGLAEVGAALRAPQVVAAEVDEGWVLRGTKTTVPAMHVAAAAVITARDTEGVGRVFVVPTDADRLSFTRQDTFNHEPQFHVELDGVVVPAAALLADDASLDRSAPGSAVDWLVDRATVALCAVAAGVAEVGMRTTAGYVVERKQFDKPIGTFQAVCHRMADCYIDAGAMSLTMLQAATQLAGAPGVGVDPKLVSVAKYWASLAGSRVGHAGLHLHGGISIDLDYPIHRYFLWSKHLELQLGAAAPQLARLGEQLADELVPTT